MTAGERERAQANLLRFTALNALSFEVVAGQIVVLFARQVGASLADIGLLAALLPLASVIQLGIAPLVNRFGPRALILAGWGARTVVAAGLFLVPAAHAAGGGEAATRLLLGISAAFYVCRAVGMSSWLPLIQELVPAEDRGVFLSRGEWLRQVAIVLIALLTAAYLLGATGLDRFLQLFAVGVGAAAWSLIYLWRLPDVGATAEPLDRSYFRRAAAPLRDPLFRRYLAFSVALRMVLTVIPPFMVVFLRDGLQLSVSAVILVNTVGSLGAIATLGTWGRWSDRVGARPALATAVLGVGGGLFLWVFAQPGPAWLWVGAPAVSLLTGIFLGGLTVSLTKFELGFIPVQGRAHYVAASVTAVGLGSAAATLAAGSLLQALAGTRLAVAGLTVDRYQLFWIIAAVGILLPLAIWRTLPEEQSRSLRTLIRRGVLWRIVRLRRLVRGGLAGAQPFLLK